MTSTLAPPAPEAVRTQPDAAPSELETAAPALGLDLVATAGLTAYSIAVAIGFSRVFNGWDFLRDLVLIAVIGHGTSYLLRRLRIPAAVAVPLVLVVLTWLVAWTYYPDSFAGPFPLADVWEAVGEDFRTATDRFQTSSAPVPYAAGWAFLAGATTAAAVWLADTFAFRAQARGEALVPGAVLFVFIAALGVDERRVVCSLAVVGTGFCALALLRQRLERRPRTVLGRARHPLVVTLPAALATAALVMGGAWAVGPRLPGANAEPLFETSGRGDGNTEIISPLVDVRSRLVNQAADELFTVRATAPSYWRIAALPQFGDDRWDLPGGRLEDYDDQANAATPGSVRNVQQITILGLRNSFVPAAPEPTAARGPGAGYNQLTSSLVKGGSELREGDSYRIESAMPRFNADQLRAATSDDPPDPMFLQLPDDLPAAIAELAAEVTAGAETNFDKLLALQMWFRNDFTYSTEVPEGNGTSAIVDFLEHRIGYCEQFAGTFGVMARTLGIPARVSVGFTQGTSRDDGNFIVRGRNSHAWPELWFDGFGWVPFEPTPGRGMPGAESYTGVRPQQDDGGADADTDGPASPPPAAPTTTTTTVPAGQAPAPSTPSTSTTSPTSTAPAVPPSPPDESAAGRDDPPFPWLLIVAAVAVVAVVLATPELVRRWRRSRLKPATDPAHMLLDLWDRALAALAAIGFRANPALTPLEVSERAASVFPAVADPLTRLAGVATSASYAPQHSVEAIATSDYQDRRQHTNDTPHDWCATVETAVESSLTTGERIKRYFTVWR